MVGTKEIKNQMEKIIQKKRDTVIELSFEERGVRYTIKDKKSSDGFFAGFEEISNEVHYTTERVPWYLNAGILWCVIGAIQIGYMVKEEKIRFPFWLLIGIGCILWYFFTTIKYTYIKVNGGNLLIIQNKDHDRILKELYEKRNEYLKKEYDIVREEEIQNSEYLLERFKWLAKLGVITKERLSEVEKQLDSAKKKDADN